VKHNRSGNRIWQFAVLMAAIGSNCKAESHCPLLLDAKPFTSHNENRLTTLIHFGRENHISFGVESSSDDLLEPITTSTAHGIARSAIMQILGVPSYRVTCVNGVVVVRDSRYSSPTWLDRRLPSYQMPRATLVIANIGLWNRLESLLGPPQTGFAGSFPPGDPDDLVGPYNIKGSTIRSLLCLLVGSSKGAAWFIHGQVKPFSTSIRNRFWTLILYSN
jgi:hypothetical protein